MYEVTTVDVTSDAFALRFANLLTTTRSQSGRSTWYLARKSGGGFTRRQLASIEEGTLTLDRELVERAVALYGCDVTRIAPSRLPIVVGTGVVSAGGVVTTFVPGNSTSLLEAYLKLIRTVRRQRKAPAVELRRDDIEVLSSYLREPGETVVERLAALMGASRAQRTAMAGLFASGAAVIGLIGTAMAGSGGGAVRDPLVPGTLHDAVGLVVFEETDNEAPGTTIALVETGHAAPTQFDLGVEPTDATPTTPPLAIRPTTAVVTAETPPTSAADEPPPTVATVPPVPADEEWPSQDLVDDTVVGSDLGGLDDDVLEHQADLPVAQPADDTTSDDTTTGGETIDDDHGDSPSTDTTPDHGS